MAISTKEKKMVGILLIFASLVGGGFLLILPQFDAVKGKWDQKTQLEADIQQLTSAASFKQIELDRFKKGKDIPADLVIRKFTPETKEKEIKEMLDQVIQFSTASGNTLISLEPTKDNPYAAPPANGSTTGAAPNAAGTAPAAPGAPTDTAAAGTTPGAAVPDPNNPSAVPAPPPAPQLQEYKYTVSVRGTFDTIQEFVTKLNEYKELVEITSVEIKNERNADRKADNNAGIVENSTEPHFDPTKPIKLTADLKLYLAP